MKTYLLFLALLVIVPLRSQKVAVLGRVTDIRTGETLQGVALMVEGSPFATRSDARGHFEFPDAPAGRHVLLLELNGYRNLRMPILLVEGVPLDVGMVSMEPISLSGHEAPLINLAESRLEEEGLAPGYALLRASRDVFLNRAAFDFSLAFFRPRGYDSRHTGILLNGFTMNSLYDGRPQWNHWGGLNDVTRNQDVSLGLRAADRRFGGVLGSISIDTGPSGMRPGYRFTGSFSNRTYNGRLMGTYVSYPGKSGLALAVSASRRWAGEGYIEGTFYDAWSAFASLEYQISPGQRLTLMALAASNRRGGSSALTGEVEQLLGSTYNPYWGLQAGKPRNSRVRKVQEPMVQLYYRLEKEGVYMQLGGAYQLGAQARSRLGYYNAPNPDPVYYRHLPSYAVNHPGGANFLNARLAAQTLVEDPRLQWESLYHANNAAGLGGRAAYLLYEDVAEGRQGWLQALLQLSLGKHLRLDTGLQYRTLRTTNFARIKDLLGASFHEDIDPFSGTGNDLDGKLQKKQGEPFGYHYESSAGALQPFLQLQYQKGRWEAFAALQYSSQRYQRKGNYRNERFPDTSLGDGSPLAFGDLMGKGGVGYHLGGRHWWSLNGVIGRHAPLLKHVFVNPRESHQQVPGLQSEYWSGLEFNYDLRMRGLKGRLTAYYTRMMDKTDIHFFFVDSGLGSDFVQEVVTGLDHLHMGVELGLEYEITSSLNASAVMSLGKYRVGSDPLVTINFDTAGLEDDLINPEGSEALGPAMLKDYHLSAGPQKAFSLGLEYRDPAYWWLGVTANYLAGSYISPSVLARTGSFRLDPDSGLPFPGANPERVAKLLDQRPLQSVYLLNLTGGKSWLRKGVYLSFFASITNVFDLRYPTGGYEQSRNGNFGQWEQDLLSGSPSFGPKYWYGYGRSFFLNLALAF